MEQMRGRTCYNAHEHYTIDESFTIHSAVRQHVILREVLDRIGFSDVEPPFSNVHNIELVVKPFCHLGMKC